MFTTTEGGRNVDGRILIALAVLSILQSAYAACTPPDCAPAEGWDNFANNLGSDFAPLLALFGEKVTTQYLSETMNVNDCLLFALAPLGIITAIVAAIRVSGSSRLRAIIGRAKETRGDVEADLMSSTSSDVCELWSGEDVVRVLGKPVLLQLIYNERKAHENDPERIFDLNDGILNFHDQKTKDIFYKSQPKPVDQVPAKPASQSPVQSAHQSPVQPTSQDQTLEQSRYSDIERWQARNNPPNLSLNVSIKPITRGRMAIFLVVGFLAQGAVLAFAAVSQYKLRLPKNNSSIPGYAFPVFLLGTATLACGVFLCARVIEKSTQETVWEPKNADTTRVVWLQQGGQKVGDQLFESFARLNSQGKVYTSQKGEDMKKERTALAATAASVTLVGFIAQFFGLRATHSSVIVLQLGAILVMTGLRSYAHARRDSNNDIKEPDVVRGYELDWLAKNLGGCSTWEVGPFSRDGPAQSETTYNASKPGEIRALELPRMGVRENSGLTPATRPIPSEPGNIGVGENPNTAPTTEPLQAPKMPQRAMMIRASLAGLSIDWDLNSRKCVAVLQRAIEESMNDVFAKMELNQKNLNEPSFQWCIPVTARPKPRGGSTSELAQDCEVSLILERKKDETGSWGEWEVKNKELEAVLCLWASSLTGFDRTQAQNNKVRPKQIRLLGPATLTSPIDYKFWIHRGAKLRQTKLGDEQERYFGWRGGLSDEYLCVEADRLDLEALCAQTLYTLFLGRLARWVDGVGGTTTTRRTTDLNNGLFAMEVDNSWEHFHLNNSNFASLATIFVRCGLGTIEQAYQCIIPAFSSVGKPPYPDSVYSTARKASKVLSKGEKWKDVVEIDSWLCQNLLPTNAPVSVIHAEVTQRLHQGCKKLLLGIRKDEQCESLRPVWDFVHTQCQILSTAKLSNDLSFSLVTRCMTYWRFNNNCDANSREFKELISNTIEFVAGRQDSTTIKENVQKGWDDKVFDEPESFARFLFDNQKIAGKVDQYSLIFCVLLVRKDSGDLFSNKEITSYFNDPESLKVAANTSANGPFEPPSVHIPIDILLSRNYLSPLQVAATIGNKQLVERLWGAQIVDKPARYGGRTALQAAASEGEREVVKFLLAQGADIEAKPAYERGRTALQAAAGAGHLDVVELLLAGDINGAPGENDGRTALQAAAEGGHRETVEFLLARGARADAGPAMYYGYTALQAAAGAGYIDIVRLLLLGTTAVINTGAGRYCGRTALQAAAENGHEEIVELLLRCGAHVDAEPAPFGGRTALQAAAGAGHGEMVKQLLRVNANVNARAGKCSGRTALQAAVEGGHRNTVALLLAVGSDINAAPGEADGITVFQAALDYDDPRMMELILASDCLDVEAVLHSASEFDRSKVFEILKSGKVNWNRKTGVPKGTPLHKAIQHGHNAVFDLLVTVCEVNLTDAEGRSPLHLAVWLENEHAVKQLVRNSRVAMNLVDFKRSTPLSIAASTGNVQIVKLLLESPGLDVNRVSFDGRTPLHVAAINGHDMITAELFGRDDLDLNTTDITGSTPLHIASLRGLENLVVRLLSQEDVNVNCCDGNGATPLILAASSGEGAIVRRLLTRSDIQINTGNFKGHTALYEAAHGGHEAIVEQLLANGAIVSQRVWGGDTALHAAALDGYVGIVVRLLNADDSMVDAENDENWTPLLCAAKTGNREIVELLLAKSAGVNHITKSGATPLLLAAQIGHDLVVEWLLAAPEIEVNLPDNTGDTPLHVAAMGGHHLIVERLLAKGMDVNDVNRKEETPLQLAARLGHDLVVEKLLMVPGINVNLPNIDGDTPLFLAASLGHHLIVKRLVARKDIDANGSGIKMPLLAAAINGNAVIVDMLLEKVDVNQQDSDKSTALWCAAERGHDAVVRTLLGKEMVNVNLPDESGGTPLYLAAQNGHEGVLKMLLARTDINVNFADQFSMTPLIIAARRGQVGVVKQLLEHKGINVNLVDWYGDTIPLHTFKGVIRELLEKAQSVPEST